MFEKHSLFLLALFAGLFTIIFTPFIVLTVRRTRLRRDYDAVIELGDSICLKTFDGSILIRRRTYHNWGLALFFGSIIGCTALVGILFIFDALSREASVLGVLMCLGFMAAGIASVAVFFLEALKKLPKRTFRFDVRTNMVERHESSESQRIPFGHLEQLSIEKVKSGYELVMKVKDGDDLALAVVSGLGARKKADQVASWVQDVLRSAN